MDIDKYAREDVKEEIFQFNYSIDDDGVVIDGYLGDQSEVRIPERIEGLPVYKIADEAFYEDEQIEKIILPETNFKITTPEDG